MLCTFLFLSTLSKQHFRFRSPSLPLSLSLAFSFLLIFCIAFIKTTNMIIIMMMETNLSLLFSRNMHVALRSIVHDKFFVQHFYTKYAEKTNRHPFHLVHNGKKSERRKKLNKIYMHTGDTTGLYAHAINTQLLPERIVHTHQND